ncbi:hypothetical protein BN7_6771 [Wickerhamomyces ciferrii]|uniref:Uncharacterized protein n=1 Tax=Wickerhamomyces ciferrii (strain ATCC 14091 / BCRC 22168 / CBS 111 / JCM 3599 / NBRC 0793 / NRRL Y-1031 F-60-10) TaxID=1206466 RepID=K0KV96_WICCF|nr:uncharacterized protein BN7_6771 [Wickerhamomyces ciferrii]CCH47156.1 hypothetical protein BN7_6771 [Wickerhamomyces ciferrii]
MGEIIKLNDSLFRSKTPEFKLDYNIFKNFFEEGYGTSTKLMFKPPLNKGTLKLKLIMDKNVIKIPMMKRYDVDSLMILGSFAVIYKALFLKIDADLAEEKFRCIDDERFKDVVTGKDMIVLVDDINGIVEFFKQNYKSELRKLKTDYTNVEIEILEKITNVCWHISLVKNEGILQRAANKSYLQYGEVFLPDLLTIISMYHDESFKCFVEIGAGLFQNIYIINTLKLFESLIGFEVNFKLKKVMKHYKKNFRKICDLLRLNHDMRMYKTKVIFSKDEKAFMKLHNYEQKCMVFASNLLFSESSLMDLRDIYLKDEIQKGSIFISYKLPIFAEYSRGKSEEIKNSLFNHKVFMSRCSWSSSLVPLHILERK